MCERRQPESPTLLRSISRAGQWFPWQHSKGQPGQPGSKAHQWYRNSSCRNLSCRGTRGRTPSQPCTNTQNVYSLQSPTIRSAENFPSQAGPRGKLFHDPLPSSLPRHKGFGVLTDHRALLLLPHRLGQHLTQCLAQNRGRDLGDWARKQDGNQ